MYQIIKTLKILKTLKDFVNGILNPENESQFRFMHRINRINCDRFNIIFY
jgi:hypothetical protein